MHGLRCHESSVCRVSHPLGLAVRKLGFVDARSFTRTATGRREALNAPLVKSLEELGIVRPLGRFEVRGVPANAPYRFCVVLPEGRKLRHQSGGERFTESGANA